MATSHGCGETPGGLTVTSATGAPVAVVGIQDDGSRGFTVVDSNGNPRLVTGELGGGHVGIRVPSPSGTYDAFYADERGLDTPLHPLPQNFSGTGPVFAIAGGLQLASSAIIPIATHAAVRMFVQWNFSDGSTTGQFKLASLIVGGTTINATTSATLGVGTSGTAVVNWLHAIPLGADPGNSYYYLALYAQTVSGAGSINVLEPSMTLMNDSHGATTGGAWATF